MRACGGGRGHRAGRAQACCVQLCICVCVGWGGVRGRLGVHDDDVHWSAAVRL